MNSVQPLQQKRCFKGASHILRKPIQGNGFHLVSDNTLSNQLNPLTSIITSISPDQFTDNLTTSYSRAFKPFLRLALFS